MTLQEKYKELIDAATTAGAYIKEEGGVIYIDGETNAATKQQLWDLYGKLDPDYSSGDLILNINSVAGVQEGATLKVTTSRSNLNIRKGPGTDEEVIGKAARHELVTLIRKENDQWWYIKTQSGLEGYCFTQYLTALS